MAPRGLKWADRAVHTGSADVAPSDCRRLCQFSGPTSATRPSRLVGEMSIHGWVLAAKFVAKVESSGTKENIAWLRYGTTVVGVVTTGLTDTAGALPMGEVSSAPRSGASVERVGGPGVLPCAHGSICHRPTPSRPSPRVRRRDRDQPRRGRHPKQIGRAHV